MITGIRRCGKSVLLFDLFYDYLLAQGVSENILYGGMPRVANALTSMRRENINGALVSSYLKHIMDAFLLSMAKRYDVKGKTYFNYPNKYYYTDVGLRNARLNYRQYDPGHIVGTVLRKLF